MNKQRIAVISDTHGVIDPIVEALRCHFVDEIIFLGDSLEDGREILAQTHLPGHLIQGNVERQVIDEPLEEVMVRQGHRILLTHGHRYGVKSGLIGLWHRALELSCSVALFGHTHVPLLEEKNGIFLFNPGSVGRPCWGCEGASWGLLEVDEKKITYLHCYL